MSDSPKPPVAEQRAHSATHHGETISDPYAWLRDAGYPEVTDPDVLDYLKAENAFFEGHMAPHGDLVETIYQEMKGRIKEDDSSVPQKDGKWIHWYAYETGGQYPIHYRKPVAGGPDEVLFDEPKEAGDKDYFSLGILEVSPDDLLMAWALDDDGAERYTLKVREIASGRELETVSTVVNGDVVWAADSKSFFYTEVNDNWRSYRVLLHTLGTDPATDKVIYEEADEGFQVGIGDTQDEQWIVISTGDNQTSEMRVIPASDPLAEPIVIAPRQVKRLYSLDSGHGKFWIITNDDHVNFRLAEADWATPGDWKTVIPGSDRIYLTGASSFKKHLILSQRVDGLDEIVLRDYDTGAETRIPFAEASYSAGLSSNPEYDPDVYRVSYSSMVTPRTTYDYDPATGSLTTLKVQQIPSGYDASQYETERVIVTARDGAKVPVSVVYKKGFRKDGAGKLFLYAYGAYGFAIPPGFSTNRISLLDRGYAFAIAHIRGGDDLGYNWYLQGKAEARWNTFNDFTDVAKGLIAEKFTSAGKIAINGGSAGGELMGVVANTDPALWGAVVADVPFVDVLSTMLDASLPLTPGEWPEWGNPIESKAAFDLIRGYSPYDNVAAQAYPPMLITGGLNDPRVTYWEPAKWAARLRATKTDDNLLLLKINMGAGHGGKSGRFESLREDAESFAFVLWQLGDIGGD
nr:S9 family peptidase [Sphingobium boeckii]